MAELDYPLEVRELPLVLDSHPHLLGIDCEMVLTAQGSELVRVVIVDDQNKLVFDRWFQPRMPVVDYITHITGITSEDLKSKAQKILSNEDLVEI
jgi:DNA polymerase III epsilon subunit-like protein